MNRTGLGFSIAAAVATLLVFQPSALALNGTWDTGASGIWDDSANWVSGNIANGVSSTATINFTTAGRTLTLDAGQNQTVGVLNIGATTGGYTLTGNGGAALIMNNGGNQAQINSTNNTGAVTISVPEIRMTLGGLKITQGLITPIANPFVISIAAATTITTSQIGGTSLLTLAYIPNNASGVLGAIRDGAAANVAVRVESGNIGISSTNNNFSGGLTIAATGTTASVSVNTLSVGTGTITFGGVGTTNHASTLGLGSGTYANDIVTTGSGSSTYQINVGSSNVVLTGSVSLGKNVLVLPQANGKIAFQGNISGTGGFTSTTNNGGFGILELSGSNSFSGGISYSGNVARMILNLGSTHALGTGTLTLGTTVVAYDNAIDNTSGAALTLATNNAQVWGKNVAFVGSNDLNMGTGAVTIAPGSTGAGTSIVDVRARKLTIGGVISGANKSVGNMGSGTLALAGANTYTGPTYVGGVLSVSSLANGGVASNIGSGTSAATGLVLNRGTLQYTGAAVSTDRLFTIGNGGGAIESNGTGELNFTNIGTNESTGDVVLSLIGGGNSFVSGTNVIAIGSGANVGTTANLAVGQTISGAGIAANTIITGILDGNRITISNNTTSASTATAYTFGSLNRVLTLTGTNAGNNSIAGALVNSASTSLGVTKAGSGKWVLNGTNTYTGTTTVNAGTLVIGQTGRISDSSAIIVNAGGNLAYNSSAARTGSLALNGNGLGSRARLSGTGSINVAVVLDNLGDTLSPGNSPGIQNFGVSQSWESFTYEWETNNFTGLTAGTDFDQISITGGLTLTGGDGSYVLDLYSLTASNVMGNVGNFSEGEFSWNILTTTAGITGFDAGNWTILTSNFTSDPAWTGVWSLSQSGNNLVLTYGAVPEPSTYAMALVGAGLLALAHRRRFKK